MTYQEDRHGRQPSDSEPLVPAQLPPELAEFLRQAEGYACVTQATDQGTAYVMKVPSQDLTTLRGTMPVALRHELFAHPAAPVIRTVVSIFDRPQHPLRVETFINVAEVDQRADFAALGAQELLVLLFFDEQLRHRLTKLVPYPERDDVPTILARADELRAAISPWRFDFNQAKAAVMRYTTI